MAMLAVPFLFSVCVRPCDVRPLFVSISRSCTILPSTQIRTLVALSPRKQVSFLFMPY